MENQEINNTSSNGRTGKKKKWILIALAGVLLCLVAYVLQLLLGEVNSVRNLTNLQE